MRLLIVGTVPVVDLPLACGEVHREGQMLKIGETTLAGGQGTGAMLGAALAVTEYLKLDPPWAVVAGDIGGGAGSRAVYEYLIENIAALAPEILALHYCLPDMMLMGSLCRQVVGLAARPMLLADAGAMYAAKAAGLAGDFDVFTPDLSELAFLADKAATHPAYISRHLFTTEAARIPELAIAAYRDRNAARLLLVKGATDYIFRDGDLMARVAAPDVPALEAIGGTGDTITGLTAGFIAAGLEPHQAALFAARTNRTAGELAAVTPASRVPELIAGFPEVFRAHLCAWSGICTWPHNLSEGD